MRITNLIQTTLLMLALVSVFSCQKETDNREELILGRWDIKEASRNGKPTESLEELFFEFFQDGNMRTNLTGSTESASYYIDGNQLHQKDSKMDVTYQIQEISDSTLIMTTELRGYGFRFIFGRSLQEE